VHNRCEKVSTAFRVRVRAPLEHNENRGHHIMGEPLTSRHDSRRNHNIMVLVRTAGLSLTNQVWDTNAMLGHLDPHWVLKTACARSYGPAVSTNLCGQASRPLRPQGTVRRCSSHQGASGTVRRHRSSRPELWQQWFVEKTGQYDPAHANFRTRCGSAWPEVAFVSHPRLVTSAPPGRGGRAGGGTSRCLESKARRRLGR